MRCVPLTEFRGVNSDDGRIEKKGEKKDGKQVLSFFGPFRFGGKFSWKRYLVKYDAFVEFKNFFERRQAVGEE